MKNSLFTFVIILALVFHSIKANAHKEWVHQYIAQESYFFLRNEVGDIEYLKNKLGINFDGEGNNYRGTGEVSGEPWLTNYPIMVGAWREDIEDPIWNYNLFNGGDASSSHFWDADNGDNAQTHIYIPWIIDAYTHNAWEKAKIYLFNGNQNELVIQHTHLVSDGNGIETAFEFKISYNSIVDLYQGNYTISGYHLISGWVNFTPQTAVESGTFWVNWGKILAYEILGRVAHLLGDMSVPAHAHGVTHPCPGPLHLGDYFELEIGNSWHASDCNEDQTNSSLPAYNWNHQSARTQGGLINEIFCLPDEDAIHYLFYTLNQLADFFPSGVNNQIFQGSSSDYDNGTNSSFLEGDANLPQGTNNYLFNYYQNFNQIPPDIINTNQIGDVTLNYAIRATASLFYWFALKISLSTPIPDGAIYLQNYVVDDMNNLAALISGGPSSYVIANNQLKVYNTEKIISGNHVADWLNYGDFIITNNVNVLFRSGGCISLEPGFQVNSGCNYTAEIYPFPCSVPLRMSNEYDQSEIESKSEKTVSDYFILKSDSIKIFPNPNSGSFKIMIRGTHEKILSICIIDLSGRPLLRKQIEIADQNSLLNIELPNFATGIYFVEVTTSKRKYVSKFAIEK